MLRRVSIFLLVTLMIAPAFAVTIDFTGVSGVAGTSTTAGDASFDGPLAALGVLIWTNNGTSSVATIGGAPAGITGPALASVTSGGGGDAITRVTFGGGALSNSISLTVWDTEATPANRVIVNAYTAGGVLVETQNLTATSATLSFVTIGQTIGYIEVIDNGGDGHVWDNLTFTEAVPEPSTFVLFGTALLGLGALRRKRR